MKALYLAVAAAAMVGGCSTMREEMGGVMPAGAMMPTGADAYMKMAHSSDMFEIESSRLALQMSQNAAVRAYAEMMIADHTRMMNEMGMLARGMGKDDDMARMPMDPHHMAMMDRLRAGGASGFDMRYKREQVMAHQEARALHANYAARGDNQALRAMAARAVPMIEGHLQRARNLPG